MIARKYNENKVLSPPLQLLLSLLSLCCLLVPFFWVKLSMKDAMMDFQHAMNRYCNFFPCAISPKVIKSGSPDFKPRIVIAIATGRA